MGANGYELRQAMPHDEMGHLVVESSSGRLLAGVGSNDHRAWCYPLNTPRGVGVVQEYAFDHAFHNGVFVGQAQIVLDGVLSNYWVIHPDWRSTDNHVYQDLGELRYQGRPQATALEHGYRFTYRTTWTGKDGRPALDEVRHFDIHAVADATICDLSSAKSAAYGPLTFRANKHGSIGARVQPQLLPALGGEILGIHDGQIERGIADEVANAKACDFVAYEAAPAGLGTFGACLIVLANSASPRRDGPWFIRDYGMAMFNATMEEDLAVAEGDTWSAALRVVAYDGALTVERASAWAAIEPAPTDHAG